MDAFSNVTMWTTLGQAGKDAGSLFNQANPGVSGTAQPSAPTGDGAKTGTQPQSTPGGMGTFMFPMLLLGMLVLLIFTQTRSAKKQDQKRKQMVSALKRGDEVVTIGGVIGTIGEIRDDEVVLKVDPEGKTRMRFTKSAIQQVLKAPSEPDAEVETKDVKSKEKAGV